ncbi:hypothetical protein ACXY88_23975, partial [Escherichia coli]
MKTFSDRWRQLDWDDIRLRINGKTAADVERALNASQLTRDDMMALLSPAASGYLEQLAQRAQIAVADDPVNMAKAFRLAVEAGLLAR